MPPSGSGWSRHVDAPVPELDIAGIVRVLNAHGVRYVVIGGVAALVHDLPVPATVDIDVTPDREAENLIRLANALRISRPLC